MPTLRANTPNTPPGWGDIIVTVYDNPPASFVWDLICASIVPMDCPEEEE